MLFFVQFLGAQSDNIYHEVFTKKDGLEIQGALAIAIDNDGFVWLGGSDLDQRNIIESDQVLFIQRFDGHNFHKFNLPSKRFKYTAVDHFYKRKDGSFFIRAKTANNTAELLIFDPVTTLFEHLPIHSKSGKIESVSKIFQYRDKTYILIQQGDLITLHSIDEGLEFVPIFSFTLDVGSKYAIDATTAVVFSEEYVLIGDDNFPFTFFDWEGRQLNQIAGESFAPNRDADIVKFMAEEVLEIEGKTCLFINNEKALYTVVKDDLSLEAIEGEARTNTKAALKTLNDQLGNHIIATADDTGLNVFKITTAGKKLLYSGKILAGTPALKLASKNLEKDFWVVTDQGELHYFKFPPKTIKNFLAEAGLRRMVSLDKDNYLIATDVDGWYTMNKLTFELSPYNLTLKGKPIRPRYNRNLIVEDKVIWSNTTSGIIKINRQDRSMQRFRRYPVACMERPTDSTIIYGTNRYNLMEFNTNSELHSALLKTDTLEFFDMVLNPEKTRAICATDKGLLVYNLEDKKHTFYDKADLEDPFLLTITYDAQRGYLLGSRSGKIIRYTDKTKRLETVYTDPLKAGIAGILFDDKGQWWVNTFNGLVVLNPEGVLLNRFSVTDGLSNNEGNRYSALRTDKGMFFGAIKGLNFFDPDILQPTSAVAQLEVLRVRAFDKNSMSYREHYNRNYLRKSTNQSEEYQPIKISSENRSLEVDFALTNMSVTREEQYQYRINGDQWVPLRFSPTLQFSNLEAGQYALDVRSLNFAGKPIGKTLTLFLVVDNFFYKTWWFYLIIGLFSIALISWIFYQQRLRNQLQIQFAQNLLQSQEEERTRIAKELHDSVGQQLTLIKKKAQVMEDDEVAGLTHRALEEVRTISRGLYPALLRQVGLSGSIEQLLLDVDEQTELFVSVEIDDIDAYFTQQQALNLYRFVQENVNNVIKHAQASTLLVRIVLNASKDAVIAEITDNGKGFNEVETLKKNSLGLKTMQERIHMLGGFFILESNEQTGTRSIAEIPLK